MSCYCFTKRLREDEFIKSIVNKNPYIKKKSRIAIVFFTQIYIYIIYLENKITN